MRFFMLKGFTTWPTNIQRIILHDKAVEADLMQSIVDDRCRCECGSRMSDSVQQKRDFWPLNLPSGEHVVSHRTSCGISGLENATKCANGRRGHLVVSWDQFISSNGYVLYEKDTRSQHRHDHSIHSDSCQARAWDAPHARRALPSTYTLFCKIVSWVCSGLQNKQGKLSCTVGKIYTNLHIESHKVNGVLTFLQISRLFLATNQ